MNFLTLIERIPVKTDTGASTASATCRGDGVLARIYGRGPHILLGCPEKPRKWIGWRIVCPLLAKRRKQWSSLFSIYFGKCLAKSFLVACSERRGHRDTGLDGHWQIGRSGSRETRGLRPRLLRARHRPAASKFQTAFRRAAYWGAAKNCGCISATSSGIASSSLGVSRNGGGPTRAQVVPAAGIRCGLLGERGRYSGRRCESFDEASTFHDCNPCYGNYLSSAEEV